MIPHVILLRSVLARNSSPITQVGSLGRRDYTAYGNQEGIVTMIVDGFRRAVRDIDRRVWVTIAVLVLLCGLVMSIPVDPDHLGMEVIQVTLDAVSTQTIPTYSTLAAQLSQTPFEAVIAEVAPTIALQGLQEVRQYAAGAKADSERSALEWGAIQAVGAPNITTCGDSRFAWSTEQINGQGTLTLYYVQLVKPTAIRIHETYNPGFITRVAIVDNQGQEHIVHEASPALSFQCPFVRIILIEKADYAANSITITVDQSTSTGGWNQIDAVELIGIRYN